MAVIAHTHTHKSHLLMCMVSTCYFLFSCYYSNLMIPSQTCSCPTYLQLSLYLSFQPFNTMNSIISKVTVGPHDADDPQDPHLDGAVDYPQIPCLDVNAEVSNLEVDHALPKKPRVKPKPIRRKKGKLSKIRPKKSPAVPLPPA